MRRRLASHTRSRVGTLLGLAASAVLVVSDRLIAEVETPNRRAARERLHQQEGRTHG